MAFQVLVKTTQRMLGSYSYMCETAEIRDAFVKRPDVWWYHYPEEDDGWRQGGAWDPVAQTERDLADMPPPGISGVGPHTGQETAGEDDDDGEDRW